MSLTNVVRRASRIVPLAIRAAGATQRYSYHRRSLSLFATVDHTSRSILQRSFPSLVHLYSTKPKSDEALLRVIDTEIQCAEESQDGEATEEVPQGFPFKIDDQPGLQTITLTRDYQGENVTVVVQMPNLISGEENDGNDDDNDEEGEGRGNQSTLPLTVKVSKNGGPYLEFECSAYPDEVVIESLSVKNPEDSEDQIAYEGPDFADLDENLQKAFHKYLDIRGIKPSTTNFLHGYMVDKDSREYTTWLKNLQKFVQA